jgi:hypothetical protein
MSDHGYAMSGPSARQLSLNIARWFTVYSTFYGLIGHEIASTMTAAGHTWTVDTTVPFTLASLRQYDAAFVGGTEPGSGASLQAFGLAFGDRCDLTRKPGVYRIVSSSPLFAGVTAL